MQVLRKNYCFRKSFRDFCRSTSIAGYKNIIGDSETPLIEKIIWFFGNLGVLIMSLYILGQSIVQFNESPTAVTLENQSYDVRNLFFPAVAVCNINQMSKRRTYEYAEFL